MILGTSSTTAGSSTATGSGSCAAPARGPSPVRAAIREAAGLPAAARVGTPRPNAGNRVLTMVVSVPRKSVGAPTRPSMVVTTAVTTRSSAV